MTPNNHSYYTQTVVSVFEQQVLRYSKKTAVSDSVTSLSYKEINQKSNQFAYWLRANGVIKNTFIGVLLEPSIDFIICILGIVKAGAIYVPLDTQAPTLRWNEIIDNANLAIILTNRHVYNRLKKTEGKVIQVDLLFQSLTTFPIENVIPTQINSDPMCVMYTSGSTGKPKGVIIPHRAVINVLKTTNCSGVKSKNRVAQFSNLAFDGSMFEIWSALLNGASLFIASLQIRRDFHRLQSFLTQNNINYMFLPTAYFHYLVRSAPEVINSIKELVVGGGQMCANPVREFLSFRKKNKLPINIINAYGPTETTAYISSMILNETEHYSNEELISIGKPIQNIKIYILDKHGEPVSEGKIGELCISGVNLALGYYNALNLNKKVFLENPFSNEPLYRKMYKTGDLVRRLSNGNLMWVGRIDDQVKIRGFRVCLSEIENRLMQHPAISMGCVISEDRGITTNLVAYFCCSSERNEVNDDTMTKYLGQYLPQYMLPSKYIQVMQFPLTSRGKIDKKKLPYVEGIDLSEKKVTYSHCTNAIEKKLNIIWSLLLCKKHLDVNKNFFDLGADSLILLEASNRISNAFGFNVDVAKILEYPSIRKLRYYLETLNPIQAAD